MSAPGSAAVSRTIDVAAPAERVWQLVSDLPSMGRLSPENAGGRWVGGAQGPALGAAFVGRNSRGLRRWSTRCTVTRCEPGRAFAFRVTYLRQPVARWSYELQPVGDGCRVTESWQDERSPVFARLGGLATGVGDRRAFTATSIEQTLARLKECAEKG